jgi:uncharacterized protein (TIGR03067 family)
MRGCGLVLVLAVLLASYGISIGDESKERKRLEGTWEATSCLQDGVAAPKKEVKTMGLIVKGNNFTFVAAGRALMQGTFTIDAGKSPKVIDLKSTLGREMKKTLPSIYELDGDTLKLCLPDPDKLRRPGTFSSTAKNKQVFVVYKRKKP